MKKNLLLIRVAFIGILLLSIITSISDFNTGLREGWDSVNPNSWSIARKVLFRPNANNNQVFVQKNSTDSISFLTNYYSDVRFKNVKVQYSLIGFCLFIIALVVLILSIKVLIKFYKFLNALSKGELFTILNMKRLSSAGIFIMLISLLIYSFNYLNYIDAKILMKPYNFVVFRNFDFEFNPLMFGLVLIAISYVFRKGIEMQQEQDLTI